jgi:hypothetical protein
LETSEGRHGGSHGGYQQGGFQEQGPLVNASAAKQPCKNPRFLLKNRLCNMPRERRITYELINIWQAGLRARWRLPDTRPGNITLQIKIGAEVLRQSADVAGAAASPYAGDKIEGKLYRCMTAS